VRIRSGVDILAAVEGYGVESLAAERAEGIG
jgi:hypothetical protein